MLLPWDIRRAARFGGNSDNGAKCGAFYAILNNTASNANWNNGAAYLSIFGSTTKCAVYSTPLGENELVASIR